MKTKSLHELCPPFKNNNQLNDDGVTEKMAGGGRSATKPVVRKHDDDKDEHLSSFLTNAINGSKKLTIFFRGA